MTHQTNINGGANVGGNVNAEGDNVGQDKISADVGDNASDVTVGKNNQQVHTGDVNAPILQAQGNIENVGRDKIINNFFRLESLLGFVKVEGLLNQLEDNTFPSITKAIEVTFKSQSNEDLVQAVMFAGEVLGDLLDETIANNSHEPGLLRRVVRSIPHHVYLKLKALGYWESSSQKFVGQIQWSAEEYMLRRHIGSLPNSLLNSSFTSPLERMNERVLWLTKTSELLKRFNTMLDICVYSTDKFVQFSCSIENDRNKIKTLYADELGTEELQVIITGVVLDLIGIKLKDKNSYKSIKELYEFFKKQ